MFEYKMPLLMAKNYLRQAKMKDSPNSKRGQEYLCRVVNEEFGIKGTCTRVIFSSYKEYRR